ncbi:olfactory receptor 5-like [Prionailurus iriomotensis]
MERPLELGNVTRVQEFVLLGLSTRLGIRIVLFAIFLALYLLTLLGEHAHHLPHLQSH